MVVSSDISQTLEDLAPLLQAEDWRQADQVTTQLMAQTLGQGLAANFEEDAIAYLPCDLLKAIDSLWIHHSQGQFGFTAQRKIYLTEAAQNPLRFAKQVGWTISDIGALSFFKFYRSLKFERDAPPGQFPAHWYWQLSFRRSLRQGGFGTGRGAGYMNADLLDALMLRLERCDFV
ncbi:MAG: GUN4 domain-containing protein [Cyanobacteria bacterium P01_C01_bin.73]